MTTLNEPNTANLRTDARELATRLSVRRAYELGRLKFSARFAFVLTAIVATAAALAVGRQALPWTGLTLVVWLVLGWRGGALLQGAKRGLFAGVATFLLPLSILRPCCRPGVVMTADCCTRPELCIFAGAALGFALAAFLPAKKDSPRFETAAGMVLGVLSVAVLKCSALFMGEAIGLLGGLSMGVVVVQGISAARHRRMQAA